MTILQVSRAKTRSKRQTVIFAFTHPLPDFGWWRSLNFLFLRPLVRATFAHGQETSEAVRVEVCQSDSSRRSVASNESKAVEACEGSPKTLRITKFSQKDKFMNARNSYLLWQK
jgi:hypothetical protein